MYPVWSGGLPVVGVVDLVESQLAVLLKGESL